MPAWQGPQATVPDAYVDSAASFLGYLYIVSQYTVRLIIHCISAFGAFFASATQALYPTFGNHRIYQLQHAKTESAPNVV